MLEKKRPDTFRYHQLRLEKLKMIKVKPVLVVEAGRGRIPPPTTLTFLSAPYIEIMFSISAP